MSIQSNAILLLSGGPDSSTLAAWAKREGYESIKALYLNCGHPTDRMELASADAVAAKIGAQLEIIDLKPMVAALGGQRILIHSEASIMPFGNAIVLSLAVAYARRLNATSILIGLHADDAAESKEYTRGFIDGVEKLARLTQGNMSILTPFIGMRKQEVLQLGYDLGVDYSVTWSCVRPGELHCGYCGACRARAKAFRAINKADPTQYLQEVVALESVPAGR